jgi:hypothetical protein
MRELRTGHSGAHAERREIGLVAESLDEPPGVRDDRFEVEVYDRVLPRLKSPIRSLLTSDADSLRLAGFD